MVSWEQLSLLFDEARILSPSQRAGYLDRICVDNASLRAELERLLDAHDRAGPFMNSPVIQWSVSTLSTSPAVFCAGEKVAGRFRIICFLGAGGMGQVYKAEDEVLSGFVALKTIRPEITLDHRIFERFKQEVSLAKKVTHDNVCRVFDLDHHNVPPYITMELVEGETLSACLRRTGKMTPSEALPLIVQMADGLQAAHRKSVIHGDFKPGNVMLVRTSESATLVKITDFGLARTADQEGPSLTRQVGTVAYMAPEQLTGGKATFASDIYSLGLVLYEMVTGLRPEFDRLRESAPSPCVYVNDLDRKWEAAILRCLERDPSCRFSNAAEVNNALRDKSRVSRFVRVAPSLRLTILSLILTGLIIYWMWQRRHEPFEKFEITRLTITGNTAAAAISPDGKYLAYVKEDRGKESLWVRQVATNSDIKILAPPRDVDFDGLTFGKDADILYYVSREGTGKAELFEIPVFGGVARRLIDDIDGRSPISFSPDHDRLAFVRGNQGTETEVVICKPNGTDQRSILARKSPDFVIATAWAPRGNTLICATEIVKAEFPYTNLLTVPVDGGRVGEMTQHKFYRVLSIAWLPNGRGLAASAYERIGTPWQIWLVSSNGQVRRITTDLNDYFDLTITKDSRLVAAVERGRVSHVWSAPISRPELGTALTASAAEFGNGIAWTPDGRIVHVRITRNGGSEIWISDSRGENPQKLTSNLGYHMSPRVSLDGKYVVFATENLEMPHIWRMDLDGGNLLQLTFGRGEWQPDVSPDSKWVTYTDVSDRNIWKVPIIGGTPVRVTEEFSSLSSISPTGKWLAVCYVNSQVKPSKGIAIVPWSGGRPSRRLDIPCETLSPVRWLSNETELLFLKHVAGVLTLAVQPLDGTSATPLTHFATDQIFWFDISKDGRKLACVRGTDTYDAVLIRDMS